MQDHEHAKSLIQVTALDVPAVLDSPRALLAAAAALPGMPEAIAAREAVIAANLRAQHAAGKLTDAKLAARLERAAHSAKQLVCRSAIREGRVPGVRVLQRDGGQNLILRNFYTDLFAGFADGGDAIQIQYLALGLSYAPTVFSQADLTSEYFRKAVDPDDTYEDGLSTFYASMYLKKSEANPTGVTTVASATTTQITLTSPTGMISGGRYQVETANNVYTFTATLSGSVLTCSDITGGSLMSASAFPADDTPQAGDTLVILISEGGMIIGSDATATLNTGKPMNRKRLETLKNASLSLSLDYIYTATSIDT